LQYCDGSTMRRLLASIPTLLALAGASGCATPTAVSLAIDSEVGCSAGATVVIVGGSSLASLPMLAVSSSSTQCAAPAGDAGESDMGTLVLVPAGSKSESIAFAVMTRDDGQPADGCLAPMIAQADLGHCIVAKRELNFIPHTTLKMEIDLRLSCLGVACPTNETCVKGACVSAQQNPTQCVSECYEGELDGGVGPGDAAPPDAAPEAGDAAPPANAVCGDTSGLQAGAGWPLQYGCPTNAGRSAVAGPTTGLTKLGPIAIGEDHAGVIVGANNQLFFGDGASANVLSFNASSGAKLWTSTTNNTSPFPAIAADGSLYVTGVGGIFFALDPVTGDILWQLQLSGSFSPPVLGPPGVVYFGSLSYGVFAVDTAAHAQKWNFPVPGGGDVRLIPALGNGTLYFIDALANHLYALDAATGTLVFEVALSATAAGSPVLGLDAVYAATTSGIMAIDPRKGVLLWNTIKGYSVTQPALLSNGDLVTTEASNGLVLDHTTGAVLRTVPLSGSLPYAGTVAVGSSDTMFFPTASNTVAFTAGGTMLWTSMATGQPAISAAGLVLLDDDTSSFVVLGP